MLKLVERSSSFIALAFSENVPLFKTLWLVECVLCFTRYFLDQKFCVACFEIYIHSLFFPSLLWSANFKTKHALNLWPNKELDPLHKEDEKYVRQSGEKNQFRPRLPTINATSCIFIEKFHGNLTQLGQNSAKVPFIREIIILRQDLSLNFW